MQNIVYLRHGASLTLVSGEFDVPAATTWEARGWVRDPRDNSVVADLEAEITLTVHVSDDTLNVAVVTLTAESTDDWPAPVDAGPPRALHLHWEIFDALDASGPVLPGPSVLIYLQWTKRD